jgi:quinol monooxygenase YgiN
MFLWGLRRVPGSVVELREELMQILEPTPAEAGCVGIHLYECLRGGKDFIIHSQWMEQAAFDVHAGLPHMKRFGIGRGADYASGAGDEVQEIRLGAVKT